MYCMLTVINMNVTEDFEHQESRQTRWSTWISTLCLCRSASGSPDQAVHPLTVPGYHPSMPKVSHHHPCPKDSCPKVSQ